MTIEERAKEYAEKNYSPSFPFHALKLAYKQGATDQRIIDIEAACELAITYLLVTTPKEVADERLKRFREALDESKTY